VGLGARRKDLDHLLLDRFEIVRDVIELIEDHSKGLLSVGWKFNQKLLDDLAPFFAKRIACSLDGMAVLPERGMHPGFELGAQAAEHHAGSWQLALIT